MKTTNLLMAAISCLAIAATPQQASRECINSLSNKGGFGVGVAINHKYLAITELRKNRVAVYSRNNSAKWVRSKEIVLPKDSTREQVKRGFSNSLQLDGDILAVGVESSRTSRRYLTRLDSETEVKEIDLPVEKKEDSILFNVLEKGEIKQITIPDNGNKGLVTHNGVNYNFAFSNNLLLIGSRSSTGGGWLFDVDRAEEKPIKIATPNISTGRAVALNEKYAAVGDALFGEDGGTDIASKTIVRALDNGSTAVIDAYGELSLSDNILATMRFGSLYYQRTNLLKVFRLDDNAQPQLIIEREDPSMERAWVQNGFLTTVESHYDPNISDDRYIRVCLEPIY